MSTTNTNSNATSTNFSTTNINCSTITNNLVLGCYHSSVDSFAPSILLPRVRVPSIPSLPIPSTITANTNSAHTLPPTTSQLPPLPLQILAPPQLPLPTYIPAYNYLREILVIFQMGGNHLWASQVRRFIVI